MRAGRWQKCAILIGRQTDRAVARRQARHASAMSGRGTSVHTRGRPEQRLIVTSWLPPLTATASAKAREGDSETRKMGIVRPLQQQEGDGKGDAAYGKGIRALHVPGEREAVPTPCGTALHVVNAAPLRNLRVAAGGGIDIRVNIWHQV